MITASQARQIREQSSGRTAALLVEVEKLVREAAEQDKGEVVLYITDLWDAYSVTLNKPTQTVQQFNVGERLKKLGYSVKFGAVGESYVPRGSSTDREIINYAITVSF